MVFRRWNNSARSWTTPVDERRLKVVPGVRLTKLTSLCARPSLPGSCKGSSVIRVGRATAPSPKTLSLLMFWRAIAWFEQM